MKNKLKNDQDVLKSIKSGEFRNCYLIYNRKSMDEADSQKNSIEHQSRENRRFAAKADLKIAPISLKSFAANGVISERHSGFKEKDELSFTKDGKVQYHIDRPKFLQLMQYLNAGYFRGVVCLCSDRISRNKSDNALMRKLRRRGIEFKYAYANYDDSSSGELHLDIDEIFDQHYSRTISNKVRNALKENRSDHLCTHRAPIGYLNEGNMEHKPFDPERAPIIKELFELYKTGTWSLADLTRHAKKQGLTTVPMRRRRTKEQLLANEEVDLPKRSTPIAVSSMSKILRNRFYIGEVLNEHGEFVQSSSHQALIDVETFNRVQQSLQKRTSSIRYSEYLHHPMRGLIRCASCERIYSPYTKKGHQYFYCRCKPGCMNTMKSINMEFVSDQIKNLLKGLSFSEEEMEELGARLSTDITVLEDKRDCEIESLQRNKKRIREELKYLRSNRVQLLKTEAYAPEEFADEITRLEDELDQNTNDEVVSEQAMREVMKDVGFFSELLNNVIPLYEIANAHQKEKIARIVFSELFVSENTLICKLDPGLEQLTDRFRALGGPIAWLSELYLHRNIIKEKIEMLQMCLEDDLYKK